MMLQTIDGRFLGWQRSRSGQLQSIQVQTSTLLQLVRIPKSLRPMLFNLLTPQMPISMQVKAKKQRVVAKFVVLMPHPELTVDRMNLPQPIEVKVCTSKHCCKNGSQAICRVLEQCVVDQNQALHIKKVGCLGHCKQAPVAKIAGQKYDRLSPQSALAVVEKISGSIQDSLSDHNDRSIRALGDRFGDIGLDGLLQ